MISHGHKTFTQKFITILSFLASHPEKSTNYAHIPQKKIPLKRQVETRFQGTLNAKLRVQKNHLIFVALNSGDMIKTIFYKDKFDIWGMID